MKFKGFEDWIEIFRGGKQVDSEGREHDGDAVIDKIISKFNPGHHEPPVVIGHPKDNDPAYGWVEGLKTIVKDGIKVLLMKTRDVVPEFEDMVKRRLFTKRSISTYPDGTLRHVGFLGAAPPAVKGLANLQWQNDEEGTIFEFEDFAAARSRYLNPDGTFKGGFDGCVKHFMSTEGLREENATKLCAYIGRKAGKIHSDESIEDITEFLKTDNFKEEESTMSEFKKKVKGLLSFIGIDVNKVPDDALPDMAPDLPPGGNYTEADIEKIRKEAEEEGKKAAEAEFAESRKTAATEARKKEIADYIEQGIKDGKILPAEKDAGLALFMEGLEADEPVQFSEGEKGKKTPLNFFKEHLERYSAMPLFKEFATKENADEAGEFAEAKADEDAANRILKHVGVTSEKK